MSIADKILTLGRQLYPTGRAFKMPSGGYLEKLHKALGVSEAQAYSDAIAIHNSILPDNDNFSAGDATDWERRLGMITNTAVSLSDRKLAIKRKMNHPGTIKARQHYLYLQSQLQAAGFDVYVFENLSASNPINIIGGDFSQLGDNQLGDFQLGDALSVYADLFQVIQLNDFQLGDFQLGTVNYTNKVANNIDRAKDIPFSVGDNFRSVFFIGGTPVGTFADVDDNRKEEFRQLILKIKPTQTVAYLFINYI